MVPSERTVTVAVGHGKAAAHTIDGWLRHVRHRTLESPGKVSFSMLNLPVYSDAAPTPQAALPAATRSDGFAEVLAGLTDKEARREAQRCLSCGVCFECDNCYAACPEDAIVKLGPSEGYRVTDALCTGCAVCFEQCPCHAITMVPLTEGDAKPGENA
jgi:Pyruvate/2-oxoacid:ferredoxin oxidoreductase delta subunit